MKLYNDDCLKVMQELSSDSVDFIFTDLPYGTTACKWDNIIPFDPMWKEIKRIMESCVELIVPSVVDVALGKDFGQAT